MRRKRFNCNCPLDSAMSSHVKFAWAERFWKSLWACVARVHENNISLYTKTLLLVSPRRQARQVKTWMIWNAFFLPRCHHWAFFTFYLLRILATQLLITFPALHSRQGIDICIRMIPPPPPFCAFQTEIVAPLPMVSILFFSYSFLYRVSVWLW